MKRTAKDRGGPPPSAPVEHIEVSGERVGLRVAFFIGFLLIGVGMMAYAASQMISPTPQSEWITVTARSSEGPSCGQEFAFIYRLKGGEMSPDKEKRAVTDCYSQLCRRAFQLFHTVEEFEGMNNLYTINHHPNEALEVDQGLYDAFAAAERTGNRAIYLGPVYSRYGNLFSCSDDSQLVDFDPILAPEVAQEYAEIAAFANDPQSIQIELLGERRIKLAVSEEYLAYAQREGVEDLIDFGWMRNAFIADFLAQGLAEQGYAAGTLTSYDGFTRNLDNTATSYSLNIHDRSGEAVYGAAVMTYQGPMSIVSLRDYPTNDLDQYRFYQLSNGEVRTSYLDPADGRPKNALHNLTSYASDRGCGEVLLEIMPVYIAATFQPEALAPLAEDGIHSVYCQDRVVHHTDPALVLEQLYDGDGVRYTAAPAGK